MAYIPESELILNTDGSIYHCNIFPDQLADTIILVGDPDRVPVISKYFNKIEVKSQKREIVIHTGWYVNKRISVVSTGMGTDNIDIVLNELDALVNIDLEKREIKKEFKPLTFIRLGTSGALQTDIPVDDIVVSSHTLGFDGLMSFYKGTDEFFDNELITDFVNQTHWNSKRAKPYIVTATDTLLNIFTHNTNIIKGITATAIGFYAPQGRELRLKVNDEEINDKLNKFTYNNYRIINFEMESSAIYGLSKLLGHSALSISTIIANRFSHKFSKDPHSAIESMIKFALDKILLL